MAWMIQKYECSYSFLGGYQCLDNSGKILSSAEHDLGYVISLPNAQKATAEKPELAIQVGFSAEAFQIVQDEPSNDKGMQIMSEFHDWHPQIIQRICPASFEKASVQITLLKPAYSEEEVFAYLSKIRNPVMDELSNNLKSPIWLQNIDITFKSGSIITICRITGKSFSSSKKLSHAFFSTERVREVESRRNGRKNLAAGQDFHWGISFEVGITELNPITPSEENNYNKVGIEKLFEKAHSAVSTIKESLKL